MRSPELSARLMQLLKFLRDGDRTIDDIGAQFDIPMRTAYRWLKYLEEDGFEVLRRTEPHTRVVRYLTRRLTKAAS